MDNILALHKIITEKTLKNPEHSGALRTTDDILVWDDENHVLHEPPKADTLENRLIILCEFANKKQAHPFVHPIIKAILLHFMLAYDHPFVDGNGRTARALFYWVMAKHNYWLMDYLSISRIIKKSPKQYAYAFLYTETDDNDVTYFIHHQLDVIIKSIKEFQVHLAKKQDEINSIENMLHNNQTLLNKLNHRQISLVSHALRNPTTIYKISAYQNTHNITYDTARTDLLKLAQLKLLNKQKMGNAFTFVVPKNIKQVIIDHKLI